jgi:hypothetical protein
VAVHVMSSCAQSGFHVTLAAESSGVRLLETT